MTEREDRKRELEEVAAAAAEDALRLQRQRWWRTFRWLLGWLVAAVAFVIMLSLLAHFLG